jgi:hypothetical protein
MAQKIEILLLDDIDGTTADSTVGFALDDQAYEIDLNADHDKALRGALAPYIEHARRADAKTKTKRGRGRTATAAAAGAMTAERRSAIRAWARQQTDLGDVPERGRLSGKIIAAYDAAHA